MSTKGIVLVGSGPSLCKEDIALLQGIPTFSFNRSFLMFDKWQFTPTFYGCFHPLTAIKLAKEIEEFVSTKNIVSLFINLAAKEFLENPKNPKLNFIKILPKAPFTASTKIIGELDSSGANATQIAVALGFKKIVLLGMDAYYDLSGPAAKSKNHFDKDYSKGLHASNYSDMSPMLSGWAKAASGCAEARIEVINASRESALTCFQRQSLKECITWLKQ